MISKNFIFHFIGTLIQGGHTAYSKKYGEMIKHNPSVHQIIFGNFVNTIVVSILIYFVNAIFFTSQVAHAASFIVLSRREPFFSLDSI